MSLNSTSGDFSFITEKDIVNGFKKFKPEKELDDLLRLVFLNLETPVVLFSMIASDSQCLRSKIGSDVEKIQKTDLYLQDIVNTKGFFEVSQLILSQDLSSPSLISTSQQFQYFAGIPIENKEGSIVGTLCVIDFIPREISQNQKEFLQIVGKQITFILDTKGIIVNNEECGQKYSQSNKLTDSIPVPWFVKNRRHEFIMVNDSFSALLNLPQEKLVGKRFSDIISTKEADWFHEKEESVFLSNGKDICYEISFPSSENDNRTFICKVSSGKDQEGNEFIAGCFFDVTDRKNIQKALVQEQYLVQSIMDYLPDSIYFKDLDSKFIRVSKSMLTRMNLASYSEMIGKTDTDFYLDEHAEKAYDAEQQIIRTGIPLVDEEEKETWPDGRITWVLTTKMPLYDQEGQIIGTFGISRDISAIKATETELLNSKNYLDHILQTVPVPIFIKNDKHEWVFLNEAWCRFTMADKSEYIGKSDYDLHPPEEAALFWERDEVVFSTGEDSIKEEVLTNNEGLTRTVLTKKTKFTDQYNNDFIIGSMVDITDIKSIQNKLFDYQTYLNNIINSLVDPVFVKNRRHEFILVNDAFCNTTGLLREEVVYKTDYDFFPKEEADIYRSNDEKVFATRETNINEEIITDSKGVQKTIITKKTYFVNDLGEEFIVVAVSDISEIKKVEKDLIRYQSFLNTILNVVPDPFYVKDAEFRYNLVNDEFCSLAGSTRENIINKTDYEVFSVQNADNFRHFDTIAFNSAQTSINEETVEHADGSYKTFLTKKNSFKNDLNELYLVGLSSDITEMKKTEEALSAKEKYYRSLIQNSTDIFSVLEADGKIRYLSPSFYNIFGYSNGEWDGAPAFKMVHPDDLNKIQKVFKQLVNEPGTPVREEYRMLKPNGDSIEVESIGTNWLQDDAIKGIVINTRDISERKKAEAEIRDKSHVLNSILSNMPVCVFRTDKDGIYKENIGSLVGKMGMVENQLVGLNILLAFPGIETYIEKAIKEGFSYMSGFYFVNNKDWYLETFLLKDESNKGIIGFTIDATESKITEKKLQKYTHNLEKINKELDQFAYVVSHDLKAPLRAIANLSEWIEEDLGINIPEETKGNMKLLRGRVDRMQCLINGILDYSRVSRTKVTYETVKVDVLLKDLINSLGVPETHPVRTMALLPAIHTNRTRLEQIFSNLISNAIKYHDKPTGNICIDYHEMPDFHQFSVVDDGPGIAKEFHEKIFVIFQTLQARDKVESTGVGLAIVKKIIEEQGGKIWIESEVGKGTSFVFTIPKKFKA